MYRYFDGRDEVLLGVLLREAGRFLGKLDKRIKRETDFASAIADGVLFTVAAARADPHLALLFAPDAAGITSEIAGASEALFEYNADFLRPRLEQARRAETSVPGSTSRRPQSGSCARSCPCSRSRGPSPAPRPPRVGS